MQTAEVLKPCPCESGINFESCCQPVIKGAEKAESAEQLLRARYSAFVSGDVDFIMVTHHPEKVDDIDKSSIKSWSRESQWMGLEIVNVDKSAEKDGEVAIDFVAKYLQEGKTYKHAESSLFKKTDGSWYFYDVRKNQPVKTESKIGRNDPCHCGSGKKYKKCHGK